MEVLYISRHFHFTNKTWLDSSHVAGNENTPWLDPGGEPDWGISVSFSACSTGKIVVQLDPPSERC
jgi:hypothetical protein